jgi:hypothetical protein
MKLAKDYLEQIILHSQQAIKLLELGDIRRSIGIIDEIEYNAEAAKWILINELKENE